MTAGRTRVKICGVRDVETALAAIEAGADAVGLVFVKSSPRYIDPKEAGEILVSLPPFAAAVGLFQDPTPEAFTEIEQLCPTHHTQFHGDESEELVRQCGPVIKAVRFDESTIAREIARWDSVDDVEAILVDGSWGGRGEAFDWSKLRNLAAVPEKPIILAGGLTPENVGEAIRTVRPFAVDVSSGVERERGVKDSGLIRAFCRAVQEADASMS